MAKCQLKPWRYNEPQMVWVSKDGRRIVVGFKRQDGKCVRIVIAEVLYIDVNTLETRWGEGFGEWSISKSWLNYFAEILDIPETIEEG